MKVVTKYYVEDAGSRQCVPCMLVLDALTEDRDLDRIVIECEDGTRRSVKAGWLSRRPFDPHTYRGFKPMRSIDLHVLAGSRREQFKPRQRRVEWWIMTPEGVDIPNRVVCKELHAGLRAARAVLIQNPGLAEVRVARSEYRWTRGGYSSNHNVVDVDVYADGTALRYQNRVSDLKRLGLGLRERGSYIRGYGKVRRLRRRKRLVYPTRPTRFRVDPAVL